MIWRSTMLRFAALVFLLQVVAAAALLTGLGAILRGQTSADAGRTAVVLRDDLLAAYAQQGPDMLARAVEARTAHLITPGTVLLLVDRRGRRIAGNLAAWPPSVVTPGRVVDVELFRSGHVAPEAMRVVASTLPDGQRLLAGTGVEGERHVLRLFGDAALLALSLAVVFALVAAWAAAWLIVRRLRGSLDTLNAAADGDLSARVPGDPSGDAFATLEAALNRTLDRVATLVAELQMATDGLAHDLKSPLTRLRSALERAAAACVDPASGQALDRALAEGDRLLAIVQTALSISRAEAGIGRDSFAPVDLSAALLGIADMYEPLAEDHGRIIRVDVPRECILSVQRELIGQALSNLVDNALKHGEGGITLALRQTPNHVSIGVSDEGRGIAETRREEAVRRFGRLDRARSGEGAGLGLALVAAVARLHGGAIRLADAHPGLVVTMEIPRNPGG